MPRKMFKSFKEMMKEKANKFSDCVDNHDDMIHKSVDDKFNEQDENDKKKKKKKKFENQRLIIKLSA